MSELRRRDTMRIPAACSKTYQVAHILLWFGNVELHLAFDEEFESQIVLGGIELVSLRENDKEELVALNLIRDQSLKFGVSMTNYTHISLNYLILITRNKQLPNVQHAELMFLGGKLMPHKKID